MPSTAFVMTSPVIALGLFQAPEMFDYIAAPIINHCSSTAKFCCTAICRNGKADVLNERPMPTERRAKRQSIIDACLRMNQLGINQGTSGNISLRHERRHADYADQRRPMKRCSPSRSFS